MFSSTSSMKAIIKLCTCARVPSFSSSIQLFSRSITSLSSIHSETPSSTSDYAQSYELKLESLKPKETFLKTLNGNEQNLIKKLVKELEVYLWMAPSAPEVMSDDDWRRLLTQPSLSERVSFLRYLAITQYRAKQDLLKKQSADEAYIEYIKEQQRQFESGGMGYGPRMYQIMMNPLRNKKRLHQLYGARVWRTMRLDEKPHVVFDMQFIDEMAEKRRNIIGNQMQYLISENFRREEPFQLTFANFDDQRKQNQKLLENFIGFYNGEHMNQTILPDFLNQSVRDIYPNEKEIVYLTRYAREMLDGPLKNKVYVICASFDTNRESIGAARKGNFRAMRLPFKKYVRWQSGPQYLPFINLVRVLDEVYESNGDWETALLNNISKRHLRSAEETSAYAAFNTEKMKEHKRQMQELVEMIANATATA